MRLSSSAADHQRVTMPLARRAPLGCEDPPQGPSIHATRLVTPVGRFAAGAVLVDWEHLLGIECQRYEQLATHMPEPRCPRGVHRTTTKSAMPPIALGLMVKWPPRG